MVLCTASWFAATDYPSDPTLARTAVEYVPHCVVGSIAVNGIGGQLQGPLTSLVCLHHCPEVIMDITN